MKTKIARFIEKNIPLFHERRLESLSGLKLKNVLKRKNPYLFKAKNVNTASELVKGILDAHLSSQEETIFGAFLENVAIYACSLAFGGMKSGIEGIDLEFTLDGVRYIVSVKSGPNWGNSSQIKKMRDNFRKATIVLRQTGGVRNVVAVNGCCYGKETVEDKGDYLKICGERFWTLITNKPGLYLELIEPIGHKARERNEDFQIEYAKVINRFTKEFIEEFCAADGQIEWEKIVRFNSSAPQLKKPSK
ncbi:PmeII family type II restriction endonuclease [Ferrigenium sp. UT5]|uniref:PmeII family type II restriction endonuclease n=1 Tax=Ferrigenium sp. UT5 TaxID=3242105 RepID=UPI00354C671B